MSAISVMLLLGLVILIACYGMARYTKVFPEGAPALSFGTQGTLILLFLVCCVFFVGASLGNFCSRIFFDNAVANIIVSTAIFQILSIVVLIFFLKFMKKPILMRPTKRAFFVGVIFFIFALLIVSTLAVELKYVFEILFGESPESQNIIKILRELDNTALIIISVFSVVVFAPIMEELFFRGVLYRMGKAYFASLGHTQFFSMVLSAIFSALFFALIHVSVFAFFPLTAMGIILVMAYEKSGNLFSPIIVHSLFNCANLAIMFITK